VSRVEELDALSSCSALDQVNAFGCMLWALGALLGTPSLARAQDTQPEARRTGQTAQVEEIYIARFVLESSFVPTDFCAQAKTGFNAHFEVQFTLRSTATRPSDGRMLDTNVKTIGSAHGCSGRTADQAIFKFYLEMLLGSRTLKWIGDCTQTKSDFPEKGIGIVHCAFSLADPLGQYVGGQLTTNAVTSRKRFGLETDPPGYTQTSIATIRLWKKRAER
jgi:hypothetical protein